jgi:hypothetical protein
VFHHVSVFDDLEGVGKVYNFYQFNLMLSNN